MNFVEFHIYATGILIVYVWIMAGHAPLWFWHLIEISKGVLWQ